MCFLYYTYFSHNWDQKTHSLVKFPVQSSVNTGKCAHCIPVNAEICLRVLYWLEKEFLSIGSWGSWVWIQLLASNNLRPFSHRLPWVSAKKSQSLQVCDFRSQQETQADNKKAAQTKNLTKSKNLLPSNNFFLLRSQALVHLFFHSLLLLLPTQQPLVIFFFRLLLLYLFSFPSGPLLIKHGKNSCWKKWLNASSTSSFPPSGVRVPANRSFRYSEEKKLPADENFWATTKNRPL